MHESPQQLMQCNKQFVQVCTSSKRPQNKFASFEKNKENHKTKKKIKVSGTI